MRQSILKKIIALGMLAILLLSLPLVVTAEENEMRSTAFIMFEDGFLEFVNPYDGGMDFDFGQHMLPITDVVYPALNGPFNLRIADAKEESGNWQASVSMTSFHSGMNGSSFDAAIAMANPIHPYENFLETQQHLMFFSNGGAFPVMQAQKELRRGYFETMWEHGSVELIISEMEVLRLTKSDYKAEITWTLSTGP